MTTMHRVIRRPLLAIGAAVSLMASGAAIAAQGSQTDVSGITSVTIFSVKPDRADAFMAVMRANIVHSRSENGNLGFHVYRQTKDQAVTVYVVETWADTDAQKAHAKQPTLIALHKAFADDLVTHPQSSVVEPVAP